MSNGSTLLKALLPAALLGVLLMSTGKPTLRQGSRGTHVHSLQGALGVTADGIFGPLTHAAVVAFQRSRGLTPDGIVGPQTWAALGSPSAPIDTAITSPSDRAAIKRALAERGWPEHETEQVIRIESGWRPAARNPVSNASGLIQFMPATLGSIGFRSAELPLERAAAFRRLTPLEQLPWIVKYFAALRWRQPGDTYLAVAAPGAVGAPNERIVYPVGSPAWKQNPAWRSSPDGPVTAGSLRHLLLKRIANV